ncbi:hypothetical protein [Halobacillus litoralis]|uniref:hypothetical protein n=1 Tax=Halobacillus litoralis TaxID=45668 RepID=UPI001CD25773|nr:hypothetical protein [Halobacillus litoralis]MCA1021515.1 hypothetical protein [Halobacillus litoralis]
MENRIAALVTVVDSEEMDLNNKSGVIVDQEQMDEDAMYLVSIEGDDHWLMEEELQFDAGAELC